MNILLTNDDGYNATGIKLLKKLLSKYGRVVIVAPLQAMSAMSVSITLRKPLHLEKHDIDVYSLSGSPADCVAFGLSSLDIDFDLVVSGCNHGLNISYDVLFSGTVGACLMGLTYRKKCLAISCENNFVVVENYFDKLYQYIISHDLLSSSYLLNVNFPLNEDVKGIKLTSLYYREETTYFKKENEDYIALRDLKHEYDNDIDSDCYAVYHSYISITPLDKTSFNMDLLNRIKKDKEN